MFVNVNFLYLIFFRKFIVNYYEELMIVLPDYVYEN